MSDAHQSVTSFRLLLTYVTSPEFMEYMSQMIKKHKEVIHKVLCDVGIQEEDLKASLPRLIPMFLSDMAYEDADVSSRWDAEVQDNVWSLRKCGAKTILILFNVFGDDIAPILLPLIETKLSRSDDETWKEREAAIYALGTIAEGYIACLYPHLSKLVAMLLPHLDDKLPLIRSISCWTLSRYGIHLLNVCDLKSYEQFQEVLAGLLGKFLDTNKRVQKAACLAFTSLQKDAGEGLVPHLGVILQYVIYAFLTDQRSNIGIVYDAIRTLAKSVGQELNKPAYLESVIILPLVQKWQQFSNSDKDLHQMLECLTSISQALGASFIPFAQAVFQRCMKIIYQQQLAKIGLASDGAKYDKETIVHALGFLYDLAEWLGSEIECLVSQCNLRDFLFCFCMDKAFDVRERAFGLLGALAIVFPVYLQPRLHDFLEIASQQLNDDVIRENHHVTMNASWAIGVITVKFPQEVSPIVPTIVSFLAMILRHREDLDKALVENSAITLGRLAWVCPDLVAPHIEHFLEPWCISLAMLNDSIKKEDAFRGLCAVVKLNPLRDGHLLYYICQAIASWEIIISEDLQKEVSQVLKVYKKMVGRNGWELCLSYLDPVHKERLVRY